MSNYRTRTNSNIITEMYAGQDDRIYAYPAVVPYMDIFRRQMVGRVRGIMIYGYYAHIRGDKTPLANVDVWRVLNVDAGGPDMPPIFTVNF